MYSSRVANAVTALWWATQIQNPKFDLGDDDLAVQSSEKCRLRRGPT